MSEVSIEKRCGELSQVQKNLLEHCGGRKMKRFEGGFWHRFDEEFIGPKNNKLPKRYWGSRTITALVRRGLIKPLKRDKWGHTQVVKVKDVKEGY